MRERAAQAARAAIATLLALTCGVTDPARGADDAELQELKDAVRSMQQTIDQLNKKIEKLEAREAQRAPAPPAAAGAEPNVITPQGVGPQAPVVAAPVAKPTEAIVVAPPPVAEEAAAGEAENVISSQGVGPQAPIDPSLRGFFPVPYTKAIIRFNAKPRVDFTYDTQNAGDDNRFITARIPVNGQPDQGGGPVFNANAKGSQLIIDVRAPDTAGSPRFYYQNDFFGSGSSEFNYRVQHLYGSIYNVTVGQTFSPFEDPDIWPDTVDYEGPNSMIFARFPLVRYQLDLADGWALNGGLSQADTQVSDFDGEPVSGVNHAPDFAFNLRGEFDDIGHMQFATVFRDLGAESQLFGGDQVFGWGLNLSGTIFVDLPWAHEYQDLIGAQLTYGHGIGRYSNDAGFFATDAAYNSDGDLEALPLFGAFVGYTHRWFADWRSTATYGYVNVDGLATQGPQAYHQTNYASVNLIWQMRERLSVGVEGLYGDNQKENGRSGDVFRTQVGVAYSLF